MLPLSATITSPDTPSLSKAPNAFSRQTSRVSSSLRQGITTDNSISLFGNFSINNLCLIDQKFSPAPSFDRFFKFSPSPLPGSIRIIRVNPMSNSAISDHQREIKLRDLPRNLASQCAKRKWPLACAFFYLILALVLTWPVVSSPFSTVPIGSESTAAVPLYNIWATWWNADRLAGGLFGYWDAPIFFRPRAPFACRNLNPPP